MTTPRLIVHGLVLLTLGWGVTPATAAEERRRVRLDPVEPAERATPVRDFPTSAGLVFLKGEVASPPVGELVDDQGRPVPCEMEVTGWWEKEKQNVKWLLLHFRASTDRHYFFEPGKASRRVAGAPVARQEGARVLVDTGVIQAEMDPAKGGLFQEVRLNRKPVAASGTGDLVLVVDDGRAVVPVRLEGWKVILEASTPARASVKATGFWRSADGKPVARVDVRCLFFKGEAFVRVEHTLTWMIQDVKWGIRELSVSFGALPGPSRGARIGLGEFTDDAFPVSLGQGVSVEARQDRGDHFSIKVGDRASSEGKRLGGWISLTGADGRTAALALRHAWQRYPAALVAEDGRIRAQLCPKADRLSFEQEAIMTPGIFNHPCWLRLRKGLKASTDVSYFYDNTSRDQGLGYLYTAEGAAFSHEMTLSFQEAQEGRSPSEMNSVLQRPVVARQDPAHAMRVPFMGLKIPPCDPKKYPEVERAVTQLGKMAMGRWVSTMNFGLLRFGMVRWAQHQPIEDPNADFYRWMDNVQYGQQLIPWLLFMRGGERRFFDDAEIVSRYAMDMNVNHYNTRGCPTGYMAGAGSSLPFNPFPFSRHDLKMQKIHFLACSHHLTGNLRAREVMEEVIAGTRKFVGGYLESQRLANPDKKYHYVASGGRETYNMNVFWANAYEETWDPAILELATNSRLSTVHGEYDPSRNTFGGPLVYLYDGLILQQQLAGDAETRDVMLRYLRIDALTAAGGIPGSVEDSVAFPWAFEQTKDRRYADAAWDIARGMADLVPDCDFDSPDGPPYYPYEYWGNSLNRIHLMPILAGIGLGDRLGYDRAKPHVFRDNFLRMWRVEGQEGFQAVVYLRARAAGSLKARCLSKGDLHANLAAEIVRADGTVAARATVKPKPNQPADFMGDLVVEGAKQGEVFRLTMRKADDAPVAVLSEAQVVHYLPADILHGHESLGHWQTFTPTRLVVRSNSETVSYLNRLRRPYTLRDARTLELLFRPKLFAEEEAVRRVGAGRMLMLTCSSAGHGAEWSMKGVEPYFAASLDDWFLPQESGWPEP